MLLQITQFGEKINLGCQASQGELPNAEAAKGGMADLGSSGTSLGEVHELTQSQGVKAGDVKLHLLPWACGQAWIAGMHQRHGPLKMLWAQRL